MAIDKLYLKTGEVISEEFYHNLVDVLNRFEVGVFATARVYEGVDKTVTEISWALKDECLAEAPREYLVALQVMIEYSNPAGSGVDLYVEVRLHFDDCTEAIVDSLMVAEGVTDSREYLASHIARALANGKMVKAVRLYAYVSATPVGGYEPTVRLRRVSAYQY